MRKIRDYYWIKQIITTKNALIVIKRKLLISLEIQKTLIYYSFNDLNPFPKISFASTTVKNAEESTPLI